MVDYLKERSLYTIFSWFGDVTILKLKAMMKHFYLKLNIKSNVLLFSLTRNKITQFILCPAGNPPKGLHLVSYLNENEEHWA